MITKLAQAAKMPKFLKVRQSDGVISWSPPNFSGVITDSAPSGPDDTDGFYIGGLKQTVVPSTGPNSGSTLTGSVFRLDSLGGTGNLVNYVDLGGTVGVDGAKAIQRSVGTSGLVIGGTKTTDWPGSGGNAADVFITDDALQISSSSFDSGAVGGVADLWVDASDNIYTVDAGGGAGVRKVRKFDSTGTEIWNTSVTGSGGSQEFALSIVGSGSSLFIGTTCCVSKLSQTDGSFLDTVQASSNVNFIHTDGTHIYYQSGDSNGTDGHNLIKADLSLGEVWEISPGEHPDGNDPVVGADTDGSGNVYTFLERTNADIAPIQKYNSSGVLLGTIGSGFASHNAIGSRVDSYGSFVFYHGVSGSSFVAPDNADASGTGSGGAGPTVQEDPNSGSLICGEGPVDCTLGDFFHFSISFYSDPAHTNLVTTVSSDTEPENFFINGESMTSDGAFVCRNESAAIEFRLPLDDPRDELFNQLLYAVVSRGILNFAASVNPKQAEIVIVVDESGSMSQEHAWLPGMISNLETSLLLEGIGPNKYGLVGFGTGADGVTLGGVLPVRVHSVNPETIDGVSQPEVADIARPFASAAQMSFYVNGGLLGSNISPDTPGINGLQAFGGAFPPGEDGYRAINVAAGAFPLSGDNPIMFLLITDEDRDISLQGLTFTGMAELLGQGGISFNAVINGDFIDGEGKEALGVSFDGTAYIERTADETNPFTFERKEGGVFIGADIGNTSDSETVKEDYIDLAWQTGGIAWSINILRNGGSGAEAFTQAFVQEKTKEILGNFHCQSIVIPSEFEFLCEREEDPVIVIEDVRTDGDDPYALTLNVHYRITFYSDSDRQSVVYSSFSMDDPKRFFAQNESAPPTPFTIDGATSEPGSSISVLYTPEILPIDFLENQDLYSTTADLATEKPLLCGTKYSVTVEKYVFETELFETIQEFEYRTPCFVTPSNIWRKDMDARNWISSGQGKTDFRVSKSANQALFPSVSANATGQFAIGWQDHRNSSDAWGVIDYKPQIYRGVYDSTDDLIWASGQGYTDTQIIKSGFRPTVLKDNINNFYAAARIDSQIRSYKCPLAITVPAATSTACLTDDQFFNIDSTNRDAEHFLKVRAYEDDTSGSFVISKDETVSIVNDCLIRLDVVGIPGAYAVRMRNEDSSDWSSWTNIDSEFGFVERNDDGTSPPSAYYIDVDRFIVPWRLSPGSGMKRVCVQVLNFFGISPVFCLNVMSNITELDYSVEFFFDSEFTEPVQMHNGLPVVSNPPVEGVTESEREIFIRVIFKDKERLQRIKQLKQIQWGDRN